MDPILIGILIFIALLVVLAFGWPIAVGLGVTGFIGLWAIIGFNPATSKLVSAAFETMGYDYAVLPLFILMAEVIVVSGIASDLFNLAAKWVGHLPGGIAIATICAATVFAAMSGSAIAGAVTFGILAIPEMKKYNYDSGLAVGTVCAGGPLSVLIPPSGFLIIYGIISETSIGKLFTAGIVPGLLIAFFYVAAILIMCKINPKLGPSGPKFSMKERLRALTFSGEVIFLIVLVVGGIIFGWFTPTEGGAAGAFGAIAIAFARKRLNWETFKKAIIGTVKNSGMVYAIMICVTVFKYAMVVTNIPDWLATTIGTLGLPPLLIMLAIVVMYFILGTAMEEMSMMMITIPILYPLVSALGFDLIWFGIICVRMMMIAGISPPMGLTMFVIKGIAKVPIQTVYRGVLPFLCADLVQVALLIAFPQIVMFLPTIIQY